VITVADAAELPEQGIFNLSVEATDTSEEQLSSTDDVTINVGSNLTYDIDGDGQELSASDGAFIGRFLADFQGEDIVSGIPVFAAGATRQGVDEIVPFLGDLSEAGALDVDGDGQELSASDGAFIGRFLADFQGEDIVSGIPIFPGATRQGVDEIVPFLENFSIR
jgi:hypothetical protein